MPSIYDLLSRDTESAAESLSIMLEKEQRHYKRRDYLNSDDVHITASDRSIIVEWCYNLADHCQLNRETAAIAIDMVDRLIAIDMVDRFFSKKPSSLTRLFLQDREKYQLLALSAFYIAIKINEPVAFDSDLVAAISQGMYSKEEVETTELLLLHGLRWRMCAPTSVQFANHILSLILPQVDIQESTWGFILDEVKYQTECAVKHSFFTKTLSSNIAIAAIFNAIQQIDRQDRRAILHSLVLIMSNEDFAPPSDLLTTQSWLQVAVKLDELASVTKSPDQQEACSFKRGTPEETLRRQNTPNSRRTSPRALAA